MNKSSPIYILLFITLLSIVFGAGVATVHFSTQTLLGRNERLHRNRAVAQAFMLEIAEPSPQAYERAIDTALETRVIEGSGTQFTTFIDRNTGRIGFVFSGMGFWDAIRGIVVLSPDLQRIENIEFLEQKETPGLGARIEEKWFTDQFKGLTIAWERAPDQRIIIGGTSNGNARNRVEAITGATQTSMALMRTLNEELAAFRQAYQSTHEAQKG